MTFLVPVVFFTVLAGAAQGSPQSASASGTAVEAPQKPGDGDSAASASDEESAPLPVSLSRIRRSLSRTPAIRVENQRVVFRVEVLGRKLTIEDILGPDYLKGPVPSGGMTHQEFLNMVTPKDVQGYAAFNNREGMTVAATSFALQWALQKAIHKFETAKQDREREAARKEVQEALADLERARAKAGLPPK
jgi:hypothetical protein